MTAVLIDTALVVGAALAICALAARQSAARRHAILAAAMAVVLLVPVLELVLPQLPLVQRIETIESIATTGLSSVPGMPTAASPAEAPAMRVSWAAIGAGIWLAGALVIGAGLVTGWIRLVRARARCSPAAPAWREQAAALVRACGITRDVAVLQSDDPSLMVSSGLLRPSIIIPAGAASWPAHRVRSVLIHELAHVRRRDVAVQAAAELLRAVYWINPLVWIACRRLRQESELACDDAVLRDGVEGQDYASDLLDIARQLSARAAWSSAPAIAHPSTLERRIAAMLQRDRNRAPLGAFDGLAAATLTLAMAVPVVALGAAPDAVLEIASPLQRQPAPVVIAKQVQPIDPPAVRQAPPRPPRVVAQPLPPQFTGRSGASLRIHVLDQAGGVVPGAKVSFTNTETGTTALITTGVDGALLGGLAGGRYEIAVSLPGFTTVYDRVTLAPGGQLERTLRLPIGTMNETMTVSCAQSPAARVVALGHRAMRVAMPVLSAQEPPRAPVRVGGSVRVPLKKTDVKPACPADLAATVTVRLSGRLGTDGLIHDLAPEPAASGSAPAPAAVEAARAAASQWTYSPARLNNVPVDVNVTVIVTFVKQ